MIVLPTDHAAQAACNLLKALACPSRLRILCQLAGGEKSVGEVAGLIGMRQAAVSQDLTLLRKEARGHTQVRALRGRLRAHV